MASNAGKEASTPAGRLVIHPLDPIFDEKSRVLVLGTMPSPKSREVHFYYGNPQNRFWRVVAALWQEGVPETNDARRDLLLRHRCPLGRASKLHHRRGERCLHSQSRAQ